MKLDWRMSTKNAYVADVIPSPIQIGVEVRRVQDYKRRGLQRPWKVTVYGNHFLDMSGFAKLEEAQARAEGLAAEIAKKMAIRFGLIKPASPEVSP